MQSLKNYGCFFTTFGLYFGSASSVIVFYVCFVLCLSIAVIIALKESSLVVNNFLVAYSLFFGYCLVNAFLLSKFPSFSMPMAFRLWISLIILFTLGMFLNKSSLIYAIYGLIFGCIFNFMMLSFDGMYSAGRFFGTTGNPNHLAFLSSFSFVLVLTAGLINKKWIIPFLIISLFLILETQSRKGFIISSLFLVLFLFGLTHKKITLTRSVTSLFLISSFAIIAMVVGAEFFFSTEVGKRFATIGSGDLSHILAFDKDTYQGDSSTKWRMIFLITAYEEFFTAPLYGIGLDGFKTIFAEDLYSHSNLSEIFVTLGIFGALTYYFFISRVWVQLLADGTYGSYVLFIVLVVLEFLMVSYFERFYLVIVYILYKSYSFKHQINQTDKNY
jgi:hypothetical protein